MADPQGLAFDRLAADYDRGRAGWPEGIVEGIRGETVLDLAAGTGKLTALLVRHYRVVIAVEPLHGMRALLERNVSGAHVLAGSAERIPLDDCSVDAVFVAEAFHWFDSAAATREVARVLRPGGTLAVCFDHWRSNGFQPPLPEAARAALEDSYKRLPAPGGPKVASGEWRRGFAGAPFGELEERVYPHRFETGRDGVAAYYVSTSSMGALPDAEREELRAALTALLPDVPYSLELEARVFRTRRR